jgi:hypothetical protein
MAENKKMKTLTLGGETFEVTDEVARNEISKIKEEGSGGVQPDLAQNDETAPDYVKNRTHYEETAVVNEPLNITWDGNTEGLVQANAPFPLYKICDDVFTDEQIALMTCRVKYGWGDDIVFSDAIDDGLVEMLGNITIVDEAVFFVREDGVEIRDGEIIFPQKGVYCDEGFAALTTTEPVEHTKTVVHKLDKKYLPDDMGGSVTVFYIFDDGYLYHDKEMTMKVSKDEYRLALSSGVVTIATPDGYSVYYPSYTDFGYDYALVSLWDDGDWMTVYTSEKPSAPPS